MEQTLRNYKIHICDDTEQHVFDLQEKLLSLKDKFSFTVNFSHTADELLSYLQIISEKEEIAPDIIFMDIRLPESDGITLGKKIKELCPDTYLVFVTAYAEYAIKGYEAAAFRYLLKPVDIGVLHELMRDITTDSDKNKKIFIKGKKNSAWVSLKDILYISAEDKYAIVYTKNTHFISDISLNKYEEQLSDYGFYRIHRKCLVNIFHHLGISGNRVQISNGTFLPISKSKISAYQACIFDFMRNTLV